MKTVGHFHLLIQNRNLVIREEIQPSIIVLHPLNNTHLPQLYFMTDRVLRVRQVIVEEGIITKRFGHQNQGFVVLNGILYLFKKYRAKSDQDVFPRCAQDVHAFSGRSF
jgi:hypothetical protein